MTHPQTLAQKYGTIFDSKTLQNIGQNGCCAFCALYLINPYLPDIDAMITLAQQIGKGLDADCTVYWHDYIANISGKDSSVKFLDIDGLQDIKHSAKPLIVRFDYCSKSHWVVVKNGKIVFNPLEHSTCVEKGKATKARLLEIEK